MRISFTDLMNEDELKEEEADRKVCLLFMMDEVYVTAGDRCVEGCALHKPSGGATDSKEQRLKQNLKRGTPSGIPLYMLSI